MATPRSMLLRITWSTYMAKKTAKKKAAKKAKKKATKKKAGLC